MRLKVDSQELFLAFSFAIVKVQIQAIPGFGGSLESDLSFAKICFHAPFFGLNEGTKGILQRKKG